MPGFLVVFVLVLLGGVGPAAADPVAWEGPVADGHVVLLEVIDQLDGGGERRAARWMSRDGGTSNRVGWRPDLDAERGHVRVEVPELWLGDGVYTLRVQVGEAREERPLSPTGPAPRVAFEVAPPGVVAVRAMRDASAEGHDGFAYARVADGVFQLPLGEGAWRAYAMGDSADMLDVTRIRPPDTGAAFRAAPTLAPRAPADGSLTLFRLGLLPVTLIICGLGLWGVWRARRTPGLLAAVLVGLLLGGVALTPVLGNIREHLLMAGPRFEDPPTSAALLEATVSGLLRGSAASAAFDYPDGQSWLVVGPSWLGLVPMLPIALLFDGITAHNLGIGFGVGALFLSVWALARSVGVAPVPAMLAGAMTALLPSLWSELSRMSLDRSTLYLVPVFFLCLERAAALPGWRWPVAAGVALAAVVYGQVYYGIYLAVACPVLVLWRVVGPAPLHRLGRMVLIGVVAAVLIVPWAIGLRSGTAATEYSRNGGTTLAAVLTEEGRSWWHPVELDRASAYVSERLKDTGTTPATFENTHEELLLVATTSSISFKNFTLTGALPARRAFWPLFLATLVVAGRARRGIVVRLGLDVLFLMTLAMGPLARNNVGQVGMVLPYYAYTLFIPGFEQLKHPSTYTLLAAAVSTVPLAIGAEELLRRTRLQGTRVRSALGVGLMLVIAIALGQVERRPGDPWGASSDALLLARPFPRSTALAGLEQGPTLLLPATVPPRPEQYIPALREVLPLVNSAPYGSTFGARRPGIVEEIPVLNHAAWLAGTDRLSDVLDPGDSARQRAAVVALGVRWIVLAREALAGPELEAGVVAFLDPLFRQVANDGRFIVWSVAEPGAAGVPP